jgi:hypothetical protein
MQVIFFCQERLSVTIAFYHGKRHRRAWYADELLNLLRAELA